MDMKGQLIIPGCYVSLETIRDFYSQAARDAGLDEESIFEVQVAVDEASSNIIDHAYGGEGLGDIVCSFEILPRGLKVELHDHGNPFDPDKIDAPDIISDPIKRKDRGLGVFFMRQMMDEVSFSFSDHGGNILTMVKYREKRT